MSYRPRMGFGGGTILNEIKPLAPHDSDVLVRAFHAAKYLKSRAREGEIVARGVN
jgi:hypothetical protein